MTSSDHEILIEIRNNQVIIIDRLEKLEARVDNLEKRVDKLEQITQTHTILLDKLNDKLDFTNSKIEWVQTSIYWGFAIVSLVIGLISIRPSKTTEHKSYFSFPFFRTNRYTKKFY